MGIGWNRRDLLKGAAAVTAAATFGEVAGATTQAASGYPSVASKTGDRISVGAETAVASTRYGKVAGYIRNDIYTFKGIPYGSDTGGSARFKPSGPPQPWTGVRSSRSFGPVCPQSPRAGWHHDAEAFLFQWDDGFPGEDCLRMNIWTPALDGKKRPVMVWLHGGGFTAGSGQELRSYDGENLARRGDVVVISINHRLNLLGYLNLSAYGNEFAESGNVGMLDIVNALTFVRDDIAAFGGDSGSVTIFGQSGGGAKVSALMAMPSARGLFHRAIVESGSLLTVGTEEDSKDLAAKMLQQLGVAPADVSKLQQMPYEQLDQAATAIMPPMHLTGIVNFRHMGHRFGWSPVFDGKVIPQQPFDPAAPQMAANIPLLVGCTLNEFTTAIGDAELMKMTDTDLQSRVSGALKSGGSDVIRSYRSLYPDATPFQLWSIIATSGVRSAVIEQATRKAVQPAPVYCYQFAWQTPVLDGRPMSFHCSELAFVFDNADRCENMTGGGAAANALAAKVSSAWIAFAKTGNPNTPAVPHWDKFDAHDKTTMIFNDNCEAKKNLDTEQLNLVDKFS